MGSENSNVSQPPLEISPPDSGLNVGQIPPQLKQNIVVSSADFISFSAFIGAISREIRHHESVYSQFLRVEEI
jgi:hypothetical protein